MAISKPSRIIIDTNLWISFIISNRLVALDSLLVDNYVRLLFSPELWAEIIQTSSKPGLKKYFKGDTLKEMLFVFEPFMELVDVRTEITVCRDPKDNFLLALAKDGKADYLLTGDKDLLSLRQIGKTRILTISEFLKLS